MKEDLKTRILRVLAEPKYQPLDKVGLSKKLGLSSDERAELREHLRRLEQGGEIARIRKDRYVIPEAADLCTGVLQVHQGGSAHLLSERKGQPDLFISAENTATAMNGDRVVARVMHEGAAQRGAKRAGRVIRILTRANDTVVGTLQATKKFFYVIADDPRLGHNIYVNPGEARLPRPPEVGDKVVVKLEEWKSRHVNPEGQIIELLGRATDTGVDMLSIIRKHHLPTEFPPAVLREAERIGETVDEREAALREDLRAQMIVTIDPDDAKDFDDAIYVERLGDGWRLGVHIADVSHYVKPGSALDKEAYARGNSVYLVDRVIPMLPEKLSNGVCSLKPGVDRLTQSAFIDFTRAGKIKSVRFARTIIRSAHRYTYKEAFAALQKPPHDALTERLHTAWELASLLRKNRFANGSLDLDFPEVKVWLDEKKRPVRLEKIENDISHQLVEEFMLAANEVVARETKNRQLPAVYRIHDKPDDEKLAEFREFAMSYGLKAGDLTHRARGAKTARGDPRTARRIRDQAGVFKKSQARRVCDRGARALRPGEGELHALHEPDPALRGSRGASCARAEIGRDSCEKVYASAPFDLNVVAEHISGTERVAADAEKESVKLKKIEFFQSQLRTRKPESFKAIVVDVRSYGLLVELPDFLLTGLVHVSSLQDDFYVFDPARLRFVGRRTRQTYAMGASVQVEVARVDVYKQQIDFRVSAKF